MQSNLIKARMIETGYTQRTLAAKLKMSTTSLNLKLAGKRAFDINEVLSLCEVLGINSPEEKVSIFLS